MKGFKVFNADWTCRKFQYEVGKTYTITGSLQLCDNGFHFCENVADCFNYYDFDPDNRVAEIEALGEVKTDEDKSATSVIRIVREISWAEMLGLANQGKGNTGRGNAGHRNAGHYNAGDNNAGHRNAGDNNAGHRNAGDNNAGHRNAGHYNAGDNNAGHRNAGHYNAGHYNAGDNNAGHYNAGHYNAGDNNAGHRNAGDNNAGDFNSCNYSAGSFCSVEPPFLLFNKPSPISRDELKWHPGFRAARQLRVVDDEGKKIEYRQAWENLWNDLSNSEKIAIQSIPNFDADVFEAITGVRV